MSKIFVNSQMAIPIAEAPFVSREEIAPSNKHRGIGDNRTATL